ncbi:hypothetical protein [Bacillus sp. SM2101]|nr:hypothetical protein [Bacillus sp. SM2101]
MKFYIWIFISSLLSFSLLQRFWPNYKDNEFPLLTDFTIPIFL